MCRQAAAWRRWPISLTVQFRAIFYHPMGEDDRSVQPSTRQSHNGSSVQPRPSAVAYARTGINSSRPRLQDPYAITVDLESGGEPALPNTMST
ncbi:putative Phospholipid-transporting ATPase [Daphnia magna]|uniref:Putative Phospholipid-transporting ATPase n=1 Tax=Daphnia magna TaxID=35525 RepID=A0A164I3S6_9CRUS|nr:putative Phospholipid-transporting ATPase [Daphnia magna]